MQDILRADLRQLLAIYDQHENTGLDQRPDECALAAQRAIALGEPLLSYDLCLIGLSHAPEHLRLRQMQGLALARSGAFEQAQHLLEALYQQGYRDEETVGILARTYKDVWLEQRQTPRGQASLRRSQTLYEEAFLANGGYYPGINAATLAACLGDMTKSRQLAIRVRDACLAAERNSAGGDHWVSATLGEASLLLGDIGAARAFFAKALERAGQGDLASTRRNARLALEASGQDTGFLNEAFPPVTVAVFSGHRIDDAGRLPPRFPARAASDVASALRARLAGSGARIGYASAASGGDILFHEAMLDLGGETHVVLPAPADEFAKRSVADAGPDWMARFHTVLERADSVIVHSGSMSGDIGFAYNNWILLGLARSKARQLDGRMLALAVWDGEPGLLGGASDAVRDWQGFGQPVEWLAPLDPKAASWRMAQSAPSDVGRLIGSQRVISMLFADAVGFSKLSDDQVPPFVEHFLGTVARVIDAQDEQPLTRNTWGDGLYLCFATPVGAGRFALALSDAIRGTDWTRFGLPATLSLRIALHCGPAHEVIDPVLRHVAFNGAHVSRAARIEPVTPPGSVYCSQPFAALCECEKVRAFACDYVGRMPLAKKFGEYAMFAVRRRAG